MKTMTSIAAALCVASVAINSAMSEPLEILPADPSIGTPGLIYQSPLSGFVPLDESTVSPALTWRAMNRAVGSYDSMAATMEAMPSKPMPEVQDMKSMPTMHDMPMRGDMKNMPKGRDMKSMPMMHDMPMQHDSKAMPKGHDMKSMPMQMKKGMPMEGMPGMNREMK